MSLVTFLFACTQNNDPVFFFPSIKNGLLTSISRILLKYVDLKKTLDGKRRQPPKKRKIYEGKKHLKKKKIEKREEKKKKMLSSI